MKRKRFKKEKKNPKWQIELVVITVVFQLYKRPQHAQLMFSILCKWWNHSIHNLCAWTVNSQKILFFFLVFYFLNNFELPKWWFWKWWYVVLVGLHSINWKHWHFQKYIFKSFGIRLFSSTYYYYHRFWYIFTRFIALFWSLSIFKCQGGQMNHVSLIRMTFFPHFLRNYYKIICVFQIDEI